MHDDTQPSKSFLEAATKVNKHLRAIFPGAVGTLSTKELKAYKAHSFRRGWRIPGALPGVAFKLLLPEQFPYATPRVAIVDEKDASRDFAEEWPHVEELGLLCLKAVSASPSEPARLADEMLRYAAEFVGIFSKDPAKAREDFAKEFISYWDRQKSPDASYIWSLLDPELDSSEVYISTTSQGFVAGESREQINAWQANRKPFSKKLPAVWPALYIKLDHAPVPPFPTTIEELETFVQSHAPDFLEAFQSGTLRLDPYVIMFSAPGDAGRGIIGMCAILDKNRPDPFRGGFRGTYKMPMKLRIARLGESGWLTRRKILRVDHDWIHGRSRDKTQEQLKKASVVILGCGALGSHVAVRLAQAGVGNIYLVDYDTLEAANVGRHALGLNYVTSGGTKKIKPLTQELRLRFPHIQVFGYDMRWEAFYTKYPEIMDEASLIISAMGSWPSEGPLNEWHKSKDFAPPTLYGWLEPRGVAAHALLVQEGSPCLQCILDDKGDMREPDSEGWPNGDGIESEPACGSVFQPFGPVDLAHAEALVASLAIGTLVGREIGGSHSVHATSSEHLKELGGRWTPAHISFRPGGFEESFQYRRPLKKDASCPTCST